MADVIGALPAALTERASSRTAQALGLANDYLSLVKPGIMLLLVLTELATLVMASRGWPGSRLMFAAVVGGVCAAGGAGEFRAGVGGELGRGRRRGRGGGRVSRETSDRDGKLGTGMRPAQPGDDSPAGKAGEP